MNQQTNRPVVKSYCKLQSVKKRSVSLGRVKSVVIKGEMHTGRDALHKYLMDHDSPVDLNSDNISLWPGDA